MKKQSLLCLFLLACCAVLYGQGGLSATGFRTTVELQWPAYTAFEPAGYNLYRRPAGGTYGAPVRRVGAYDGYTDYGLAPATAYFYQVAAFDAAGNEAPRSAEIAVSTTTGQYLKVASLDLLVPIYTGGMPAGEPQRITNALELARTFYFRNTQGRLNLNFHFRVIPGYAPFNADGFADFTTIENDLRVRGVLDNQYDAIHTVANQLYGFYGGAFMFGQTAGSMAYVSDPYPTLSTDVSGDTWVFIHEFGHALDLIIANYSGFPEMLFNHFNLNYPLPPELPYFDAGIHLDGMALILRLFTHHLDYAAPWDGYFEAIDADTDGLADNDLRLPVDELGFGSSAFTDDSDLDGLTDLEEFYAGNYGGADPTNPDTDADGAIDGADIYPISNFSPELAKTSAPVSVDGALNPAEGWQPLASNPNFSKLPGATLSMSGTWDDQYLYFAFQSNHELKYYLSLDASGLDGIWTTPVKWPTGDYSGLYETSYGDNYYETSALIIRADAAQVYLTNNPVPGSQVSTVFANGVYTTEVRLPHNLGPGRGWSYAAPDAPTITALSFAAGDVIGLDLLARPLAGSNAYDVYDYRDVQWLTLNELFHFYDLTLTVGPPANYCASTSSFPWHEWIAGVKFGTIDQTSGKSPYSDFTHLSTALPTGLTAVELTTGFSYFTWDEFWRVWIDLNRDGDFTDAGETVFQGIQARPPDGTTVSTLVGNLNIPTGTLPGAARLRVAMKRGAYAGPCETLPFGEVEDYTVHLTTSPAQLPNLVVANYEIIPSQACYTNPGQTFTYYAGLIHNNGTAAAGTFAIKTWFSKDQQLDATDVPWQSFSFLGVAANDVVSWSITDPVPASLPPGIYYVILQIDPDNAVAELNEIDNQRIDQIHIGAPDFVVGAVAGVPASTSAGSSMNLTIDIVNLGDFALGDLSGDLQVKVYLSTDDELHTLDDAEIGSASVPYDQFSNPPLHVDGVATVSLSAAVPTFQAAGHYYLFALVLDQCELSTGNNHSTAVPIEITGVTTTYCASSGDFPWHEWIASVQLGNFANPSGKAPYSDFTGQNINVAPGESYAITLTAGFSYYTWDEYWRVWIDFNHDGVFSTPDELVQQRILTAPAAGTATAAVTGLAVIPAWAPLGPTRMRVSMQRGAFASACASLPFGEVEDYTVNIGTGSPALPCGFSQTYTAGNGSHGIFAEQTAGGFRVIGARPLLPTGTTFLDLTTDPDGVATSSSEDNVSAPQSQAPVRLRDGNYLFVSTTGDQQLRLEKRPAGGLPLWTMTYALPNSEGFEPVNVIENYNGDLFVAGTIDDDPAGAFYKLFTLKVNSAGVQQWLTTHTVQTTPGNFPVKALDGTQDGGLIVYVSPQSTDQHIVRLAGDGSLLWNTKVSSTPLNPIRDAAETSDGRIIVAYTTDAIPGPSPANVHFASLSPDGEIIWVRSQTDLFGVVANPLFVNFAQPMILATSSGRFTVAFTGPGGLYLAALSPAGTVLWTSVHALSPAIGFFGRGTDGGYLLAGSLNNELWLMKTDHAGALCDPVTTAPAYCAAAGAEPWHDWIARVQLHTLDNASGKSPYSDFTGQSTTLQQGESYTVTLTSAYSWQTFDEYWRVWIDFNRDGVFSTPDEVVQQQILSAPPNGTAIASVSGSINVSAGALTGATRMRVAMKRGGFPSGCENFVNGEVEDYGIVIGAASSSLQRAAFVEPVPDFTILPNPATTLAQVALEETIAGPVLFRILGAQGALVKSLAFEEIRQSLVEIPLYDVPPGYYFLQLQAPGRAPRGKGLVVVKR
jgi:hypothetical protein